MTRMRQSALWLMTWLQKKGMNALLLHVHQTFLSLLVSFLLSHRSQFYQLQQCTTFPSRHYPSEDHGIAGKPQLMNVCVCFRIILSNHFKISKIWGFIWLLDKHTNVSHRAGVSEGHRKGDAPTFLLKKKKETQNISASPVSSPSCGWTPAGLGLILVLLCSLRQLSIKLPALHQLWNKQERCCQMQNKTFDLEFDQVGN